MSRSAADRLTLLSVLVALAAGLVITAARTVGGPISDASVLLSETARIGLAPGIDSEQVEEVSMRIRHAMCERWPQADQVFLDITNAPPRIGL